MSFIDRYIAMVDEAIKAHGTKRPDPEIPPDYKNPRGLPEAWLKRFLSADRAQLALDVIRAFDEHWKLERRFARAKVLILILSLIVSPVIDVLVKLLLAKLLR